MTEPGLATPPKSGMKKRGHLFKALRNLANEPKATPKQRLEACKMLFILETRPSSDDEELELSPENAVRMREIIDKMKQ